MAEHLFIFALNSMLEISHGSYFRRGLTSMSEIRYLESSSDYSDLNQRSFRKDGLLFIPVQRTTPPP